MEKTEFEFQHYYIRWLGALPCLVLAFVINFRLEHLQLGTVSGCIVSALIIIVLITVYYMLSEKRRIFRGTGYFWTEHDIFYIQTDKKIREVTDIKELLGDVKSVYGSRFAILLIETDSTKIKLFSLPLNREQGFEDSSLYPLYLMIRSRAEDLKPVKVLGNDTEYWYKRM